MARERVLHRRCEPARRGAHLRQVLADYRARPALALAVSHPVAGDRQHQPGAHDRGRLPQQRQVEGAARGPDADRRREHRRHPVRRAVHDQGPGRLSVQRPAPGRDGPAGRRDCVSRDRRQVEHGLRAVRGPRGDRRSRREADAGDPRPVQDRRAGEQGHDAERPAARAGPGRVRRRGEGEAGPGTGKERGPGVLQRRRSQGAGHRSASHRGGERVPAARGRHGRRRRLALPPDHGRVQQGAGGHPRAHVPRDGAADHDQHQQGHDRRQGRREPALPAARQDHPDVGRRAAGGDGRCEAVGERCAAAGRDGRALARGATLARAGGAAVRAGLGAFIAVVLVLVVLASLALFTVDQRENAIVFQLGEIKEVITEPGLRAKWPLIQNVRYFDKRILTIDEPDTERFVTSEKKNLLVDSFVKWRIDDVRQYYISMNGDEARARSRLTQIVNSVLREEIGKRNVQDVVSGERDKIMQVVRDKVLQDAKPFGIQIVDVRLKRVELPQDVSESVYRRMEAERRAVASQLRSQGASEAEKIRAEADKDREVIIAEAYRDAQRVKGEGDAKAAAIYAKAFSENPEFYSFYRSLEAYRSSFRSRGDVLVLEPSSEFFKYLRNPGIERRANPK